METKTKRKNFTEKFVAMKERQAHYILEYIMIIIYQYYWSKNRFNMS